MNCNSVVVWGEECPRYIDRGSKREEWFEHVDNIIRHPTTLLSVPPWHQCLKFTSRLSSAATGLAASFLVWNLFVPWPWPWTDLVTSTYLWSIVTIRLGTECDHPPLAFCWHIFSQFCLNYSHENDSEEDCIKYWWFPVDFNCMYQYIPLGGPEY